MRFSIMHIVIQFQSYLVLKYGKDNICYNVQKALLDFMNIF